MSTPDFAFQNIIRRLSEGERTPRAPHCFRCVWYCSTAALMFTKE